jgi:peptide deformylase
MPLRPILILPDKRLREKAAPVTAVDDEIRALMDDMLETMYAAPGIGLAATQIGEMKRVLVLDVAKRQDEDASANPLVFANPEILWASEELSTYNEGCLSIPEIYEEVERPARIRVGYLDRDNKRQEIEAEGILATCLQHEIDHLNGVLFIDHISRLKREMISKKFSKAAMRGAADARHDNDDEAETRQAGLEG